MVNLEEFISKFSGVFLKQEISLEISEILTETPDSLVGTHMASICEYVIVRFKGDETSKYLFWKRKLVNPNPKIDAAMGRLIVREGIILTSIVKEMSDLCIKKLGDNDNIRIDDIFPRVYHADEGNILMENMTFQGYQMLDKLDLQNFSQAKLVLQNLAKLHATSYALIQTYGGQQGFLAKYPELSEPMFNPGADLLMSKMFGPSFSGVLRLLKNSTDPEGQKAFLKLQKFDGEFASTYLRILRTPNIIGVLNHGDCWNNNIMFQLNGAKTKLVFVDFQISRISSPNVDIGFYLFSTVQPTVRKRWKELLTFYFDNFRRILQTLECWPNLDFQDFLVDFAEKAKIGFLFGILMNACKDAIKGYSTSKSDGKIEENFTRLFHIWIEQNPGKSAEITHSVIEMLNDFESFGNL